MSGGEAIRFAVEGPEPGQRSWEWRVWTHGAEIYAAPRYRNDEIRLSIHSSGHCHLVFRHEAVGDERGHRAMQFRIPPEIAPGLRRLFAIIVPYDAVFSEANATRCDRRTTSIPAPGPGEAIEFDLCLEDASAPAESWPGQQAMSAHLIGRLPRDEQTNLTVVWRRIRDVGVAERRERLRAHFERQLQNSEHPGAIWVERPEHIIHDLLTEPGGVAIKAILIHRGEVDGAELVWLSENSVRFQAMLEFPGESA